MRQFVFILSLFAVNICSSQNNNKDVLERLAKEIRKSNLIETEYFVGECFRAYGSQYYLQIDSFVTLSNLDDASRYLTDISKPLRLYSFVSVMKTFNDSLVLEKLKPFISDTSKIGIRLGIPFENRDTISYTQFNSFVLTQYEKYLRIKYLYGFGDISNILLCCSSGAKSKKAYKAKLKEYKREIESQMPNFKH